MTQHRRWVHQGNKFINCLTCNVKFATKQILSMHVASVHEKIKEFDCLSCNSIFSHKSTFDKHVAVIHNGKTPSKSKSLTISNKRKENQMLCSKFKKIITEKTPLAVHEEALH